MIVIDDVTTLISSRLTYYSCIDVQIQVICGLFDTQKSIAAFSLKYRKIVLWKM